MKINGSAVLVTGGGRGIGLATAAAFARAGARVAIGDVDEPLAVESAGRLGSGTVGVGLDVTSPASFAEGWGRAEQVVGPITILVNNAGIMPTGSFVDESEASTDRQIAVNLRGVLNGCRLAGRTMTGGGAVVNIASLAGATGFPGVATYSATKFAVVGLSQALRAEFEPRGIAVHVVLPGVVRTELSAGMRLPGALRGFVTVDPEDVAGAVVESVGSGRFGSTVPRRLGFLLRCSSLVPDRVRRGLERRTGYDDVLSGADPAARRAYEARIAAGSDGA